MRGRNKLIILLVGIICLSVLITSYAQDFRQVNWGMSKEDVIGIEDRETAGDVLGDIQEFIYYDDEIINLECVLAYVFVQDKLTSAGYVITEPHANDNAYIDDYEYLKELLIKKYGKPDKDEIIWKDESYKNDKNSWGMAISKGDLLYNVYWDTPTTDVEILLTGDNYKVELVIKYVSKELKEWATKTVREASLSNL